MRQQRIHTYLLLLSLLLTAALSTACSVTKTNAGQDKPAVAINIAQSDGIKVGQEINIQMMAMDAEGISRIELKIDGQPYATLSAQGNNASFNAAQLWKPETTGSHVIQAQAFDINNVASDPVQSFVTVADAPTASQAQDAAGVAPTATALETPALTPTQTSGLSGAADNILPTATNIPPTNTPVPPTATPVPPTATNTPPTVTPVPPTNTPVPPTVTPLPSLPVIHSFTANRYEIDAGQDVTLQWSLDGAEWAQLRYTDENGNPVEAGVVSPGSITLSPSTSTSYTLIAHNAAGDTTAQVDIQVNWIVLPLPLPLPTMQILPTATPMFIQPIQPLPVITPIVIPGP